jgi:hypothetical protein
MDREDELGEKILAAQKEEARLEREFKEATILLSRQIPELIREMQLLRGAIDRS